MGVVYRGKHVLLGTDVAVRILRPEVTVDERAVRRFEHEARISSPFQHAGIAKVTDFGQVEGSTSRFLGMDFVEGVMLPARIEQGPLPVVEVRGLLAQVADAQAHPHGKGVVHRIVSASGRSSIVDSRDTSSRPRPPRR